MKEAIKAPEYKDMELVDVVYGDDAADKSYREAVGLFEKYPDLAGIISPTTVGVLATAKAIEDEGLKGKVQITGLGLPSEMQHYIENGTCGQMALWNPVDLGYSSTYILARMIAGDIEGKAGDKLLTPEEWAPSPSVKTETQSWANPLYSTKTISHSTQLFSKLFSFSGGGIRLPRVLLPKTISFKEKTWNTGKVLSRTR